MKFGLSGIRTLLAFLDHPEKQFSSIHIAGTNGKGSTASMISSIYTAAGYRTGLYTSPHLIKINERIRIDGQPISSRDIARLTSGMRAVVKKNKLTFFETMTAMAFKYFAESNVDIAIVETGLGGRFDATNAVHPLVSVITNIGLEHTKILGNSLQKIAQEKGGIIKKGVPCVTGADQRVVIEVLSRISKSQKSKLIQAGSQKKCIRHTSIADLSMDMVVCGKRYTDLNISLAGEHQADNAAVAVHAVTAASQRSNLRIDEDAIRDGLNNIQKYSGLRGRLSIVRKRPMILVDVAHNPDAVNTLCLSVKSIFNKKLHVVFGIMKDKDHLKIVSDLQSIAEVVFIVEAHTQRSRRAEELVKEFKKYDIQAKGYKSVARGVSSALKMNSNLPILITGSHFVVGEALAYIDKEKYLTINQ
jgi:dihydrofolate synthase / folylpolyglutamate synthase